MAVPSSAAFANDLSPIQAMLRLPENQIDLGKAKLTIDKMIDPSIDIMANLKKIDSMVANIQMGLLFNASSPEKLQVLRTYLYTANPWNGQRPYQYDLADPYGEDISHKLLPSYLESRKGNCVSMPFLFIILGQRLGLEVTAATAPEHIFVKYKANNEGWINLEATSGANTARDVWLRQQMPMTDEAIANGVYLRPLSKKETVALMTDTLIEHYMHKHQYEKAIEASDMVLEYSPKAVNAMLHKGASYARLIKDRFINKYPRPDLIPLEERSNYAFLDRNSRLWYDKAEALGWRMPTEVYKAQYKQVVERARLAQ
ncbi:MAG: hypothetical protein M0P64_02955 [Candidatus Pacebacteria bacterium]|nr:hypothetical protein [Candidatus Paceibacterota bacterium]